MHTPIRIPIGPETLHAEWSDDLQSHVLRFAPLHNRDTKEARDALARAGFSCRLLPQLAPSMESTESPQGNPLLHGGWPTMLCPESAVLMAPGVNRGIAKPFASANPEDFLRQMLRLIRELSRENGSSGFTVQSDFDPVAFLYVPGRSLRLVAGPWFHLAVSAGPRLTRTVHFFRKHVLDLLSLSGIEKQLEQDPACSAPLQALKQPIDADELSFADLIHPIESLLATRDIVVPNTPDVPLPQCKHCTWAFPYPAEKCGNCGRAVPSFGGYSRFYKRCIYRPDVGRNVLIRTKVARRKQRQTSLRDLNSEFAAAGDIRVIDRIESNDDQRDPVAGFVLSTPVDDEHVVQKKLLPLIRRFLKPKPARPKSRKPALKRRSESQINRLQAYPHNRGVQYVWGPGFRPETKVHLWWSTRPFSSDEWDYVQQNAADSQTLPGNMTSHVVEVSEAVELYAAIGAECEGDRTAVVFCDGFRASPRDGREHDVPPTVAPVDETEAAELEEVEQGVPALEYESSDVLERGKRNRRRILATIEDDECELLEWPTESARAAKEFYEWQTSLRTEESPGFPGVFPEITCVRSSSSFLQIATAPGKSFGPTLLEWCQQHRDEEDFYQRFFAALTQLLDGLGELSKRGFCYGVLFPERVRFCDSSEQADLQLDWPLEPMRLGEVADDIQTPLGYVAPEFGRDDCPADASWDLFAFGAMSLACLMGEDPHEVLSDPSMPMIPPRVMVPDLPAGMGGFWNKLLQKNPARRFPDFVAARQVWDKLIERPKTAPGNYEIAGARHVGVGKRLANPRNQDQFVIATSHLADRTVSRERFDECDDDESHWTLTETIPGEQVVVVAVTDGISTVDSGEFAAEQIAISLNETARSTDWSALKPAEAFPSLFERSNAFLGSAIEGLVQDEGPDSTRVENLLSEATSPSATLAAALLSSATVTAGCVGDSRLYLLRAGVLDQMTLDGDQLTQSLLNGGDWGECFEAEDAKELVSWIGAFQRDGNSTRLAPLSPKPITQLPGYWQFQFESRPGDCLCLCSDGVSDYVDAGQIDLQTVLSDSEPDQACRRLVQLANECGGHDNISVVVVHIAASEAR